jgi:glycerol uptake operon antiterminator
MLSTVKLLPFLFSTEIYSIFPGIAAPYFIEHVYKKLLCPVIAGGLISDKSEIEKLFQKGVLAISTSRKELW